jgi:hypothetical protein
MEENKIVVKKIYFSENVIYSLQNGVSIINLYPIIAATQIPGTLPKVSITYEVNGKEGEYNCEVVAKYNDVVLRRNSGELFIDYSGIGFFTIGFYNFKLDNQGQYFFDIQIKEKTTNNNVTVDYGAGVEKFVKVEKYNEKENS